MRALTFVLPTLFMLVACAAHASPRRHSTSSGRHRHHQRQQSARRNHARAVPVAAPAPVVPVVPRLVRPPTLTLPNPRPALGTPSAGCALHTPRATGVSEQTLIVNGIERRYLLSVPERAATESTPLPLVFAFHGLTGTPTSLRGYFRVERAASEGAIVVYPAGQRVARGQRSVTRWELRADGADVTFFDALLAHMNSTYCIDRGRVFATGHSAGAVMTNAIGCHRGDVLRAIAPVAGSGPWGRRCTGAPSVWITHGRADDPVPYREGEATRDRWLGAEHCNATPEAIEPAGCLRYTGCEGGASVVFCAHDGDHGPPAYAPREIWSFFMAAR